MARQSRKLSGSGIYHVMLRGINKQQVFEDEDDNEMFLWCLSEVKKVSEFKLFAYCLMGNHVHLLIKTGKEPISQIFRRLGARFVWRYNRKYQRCGNLFQDRFKSEPVEDDAYFATVLTYIHQNPVKAGMCEKAEDYEWSSRRLLGKGNTIIDEDELSELMPVSAILEREKRLIEGEILEPRSVFPKYLTDKSIRQIIDDLCGAGSVAKFEALAKAAAQDVTQRLLSLGAGIKQISRLTGMSYGKVKRYAAG